MTRWSYSVMICNFEKEQKLNYEISVIACKIAEL